ncbi:hypothetical protein POM88_052157 [Heracleum sosnowskyi]|uniref:Uncharacterized protein n=1 Tax=Heracleum sosnowskyi TaxID=360622 RepID=A0AAD8LZ75_9APIA|nr:hypothetical protein POM88_052157 [Heracleum sosnowskyi]
MICHAERFCERLFDTPLDKIEKPFGAWMRAEPRRKMHTMGAKWLRPGGISPTTMVREDGGGGSNKSVTEIVAHKSQPNEKSGQLAVNVGQDTRIITGENKGITSAKNQEFQTGHI